MQEINLKASYKELLFLFILMLLLASVGSLGYMLIEEEDFFDSLYMTIITISTVGYKEVFPLSSEGRIFTIILIVGGVATAMVFFTVAARFVLQANLADFFERRNVKKMINNLNNHTIFCGYSRLAKIACYTLKNKGEPVVVVESDPVKAKEALSEGFLTIEGDACEENNLIKAGVANASKLAALLPKEADNLYSIMIAKDLNPELLIIARAETVSAEKNMRRVGARKIISPYRIGGQSIADSILRPHVAAFLELATWDSSVDFSIEELVVSPNSKIVGKTLVESGIRNISNVIIVAVITKEGEQIFNPRGNLALNAFDTLICVGKKEDFKAVEDLLLTNGD